MIETISSIFHESLYIDDLSCQKVLLAAPFPKMVTRDGCHFWCLGLAASKMAGIGEEAYNLQKPLLLFGLSPWFYGECDEVFSVPGVFFNLQGAIQVDF